MNYETLSDRQLDALVAEKVMGWTLRPYYAHRNPSVLISDEYWFAGDKPVWNTGWNPSTSIADAWQVVDKMRQQGKWCDMLVRPDCCRANFAFPRSPDNSWADTMPRAICLAALTAVTTNT